MMFNANCIRTEKRTKCPYKQFSLSVMKNFVHAFFYLEHAVLHISPVLTLSEAMEFKVLVVYG